MANAHTFDPTILREYDIRGIVGDTLTQDDAYAVGRSFGTCVVDVDGDRGLDPPWRLGSSSEEREPEWKSTSE